MFDIVKYIEKKIYPISGGGGINKGVILRLPSARRVSICLSVGP